MIYRSKPGPSGRKWNIHIDRKKQFSIKSVDRRKVSTIHALNKLRPNHDFQLALLKQVLFENSFLATMIASQNKKRLPNGVKQCHCAIKLRHLPTQAFNLIAELNEGQEKVAFTKTIFEPKLNRAESKTISSLRIPVDKAVKGESVNTFS